MSHKYGLGQSVVFSPGPSDMRDSATAGKITRLLPKEGADYHYYIEFGPEGRQRRVWEKQLRVAAPTAEPSGPPS